VYKRLDSATLARLAAKLIPLCEPALRLDVSNYARGRRRVWLNIEPSLTPKVTVAPALPAPPELCAELADAAEWRFDWALVTHSGDDAAGIRPHRDAAFAAPIAVGLNLVGRCRFDYWENALDAPRQPTTSLMLEPGDVVKFDCKKLHAATPEPGRWNVNLWRAK
jgi:hypothetical protein